MDKRSASTHALNRSCLRIEFYKNVSINDIERSLAFLYAVHAVDRNESVKQHQYPNYSAKDSSPDTELWMVASSLDGERNPYSVDLAFL